MNRQDAIKALLRAGKGQEVRDLLDRKARTAESRFAEVRADESRTDDYKRWALAVESSRMLRELTKELDAMAGRVVSKDRDDAESVFGVRGIAGDPASLTISRRDAGDRVAGLNARSELRELLQRATRSGDEVLARAVAERATELRYDDVMHHFLADRPALDAAGERLWNSQHVDHASMGLTVGMVAFKPEELAGMNFDSIEAVAESGEPGQTTNASAGSWGGFG